MSETQNIPRAIRLALLHGAHVTLRGKDDPKAVETREGLLREIQENAKQDCEVPESELIRQLAFLETGLLFIAAQAHLDTHVAAADAEKRKRVIFAGIARAFYQGGTLVYVGSDDACVAAAREGIADVIGHLDGSIPRDEVIDRLMLLEARFGPACARASTEQMHAFDERAGRGEAPTDEDRALFGRSR